MDRNRPLTKTDNFWLEGPSVFEQQLDPACLMVFPGLGVMRAAEILDSLKSAPRWMSVTMTDRALARPGAGILVLGYKAEGRRESQPPYRCYCTSTYREEAGSWKLVQHQQTLAE
jgi:hypothetical protein